MPLLWAWTSSARSGWPEPHPNSNASRDRATNTSLVILFQHFITLRIYHCSSHRLNANTLLHKYCHCWRPRIKEQENYLIEDFFFFLYTRENWSATSQLNTNINLKTTLWDFLSTQEIFFIDIRIVTKYRSF